MSFLAPRSSGTTGNTAGGYVVAKMSGSRAQYAVDAAEACEQIKSSSENVPNPYKYVGAFGVQRDPRPALYFMQARHYLGFIISSVAASNILCVVH